MNHLGDDNEQVRTAARRAYLLGDDFDDDPALAVLSQSPALADRKLVAAIAWRDALREAVWRLHAFMSLSGYENRDEIALLDQLTRCSGDRLPVIEMLKRQGLAAAGTRNFESAIRHLEQAQLLAAQCSTSTRSGRLAWNYLCDAEIDAAYERLASLVSMDRTPQPFGIPLSCAVIVSGIVDENSGTAYVRNMVIGLRDAGFNVRVLSTGHALASGDRARADFEQLGIDVFDAGSGTYEERLSAAFDSLVAHPVHAAIFVPFIMDGVAKIMSCVRAAPVQVYVMSSFEPYCGSFDRMLFINENQAQVAHGPAPAMYLGNGAGLADAVENASPTGRAALGIPDGGTLFGTVGRLLKLLDGYVPATIELLQRDDTARLALAGPEIAGEQGLIEEMYRSAGVRDRVHFLGRRQHDVGGILKTFDVYLDPFPESGGQALFEAMRSGRPVVGMEDAPVPAEFRVPMCLSAVTERLGDVVEIARGGSIEHYVRLALRYARDPELRARDGAALVAHSREKYDPRKAMDRLGRLLRQLVGDKGAFVV